MIRAAVLLLLALPGPAAAQGSDFCAAVWQRLTDNAALVFPLQGQLQPDQGGDCVISDVVLETPGDFVPDWHAATLRLRGGALGWLVDGKAAPDRLEVEVSGLHLVVRTGHAQTDYLLTAQARANTIKARAALSWDATAKVLLVDALEVDFPGPNRLELTARIAGVDLSSTGAAQMSLTSFAVKEADLLVQSHGLFEWYVLNALGPSLLPYEGDMLAAEAALKADASSGIAALPEAVVPATSKAALQALVAELPNPSGTLTLSLRASDGFGPSRLMGYAMTGVPATLEGIAPVFDGVLINIGWTHAPMP